MILTAVTVEWQNMYMMILQNSTLQTCYKARTLQRLTVRAEDDHEEDAVPKDQTAESQSRTKQIVSYNSPAKPRTLTDVKFIVS